MRCASEYRGRILRKGFLPYPYLRPDLEQIIALVTRRWTEEEFLPRSARDGLQAYGEDLARHDVAAIADRYDRRGAYLMGHGRKTLDGELWIRLEDESMDLSQVQLFMEHRGTQNR